MENEQRQPPPAFPPQIAKAVIAVMKEVQSLAKDKENQFGGFNYASVDDFFEMVRPKIAENGLFLLPTELRADRGEIPGGRNGMIPIIEYVYSMMLIHESGASWCNPEDKRHVVIAWNGAQTSGIALSYFEKQYMRSIFKIPTGEKDADATDAVQAEATAAVNAAAKEKRAEGKSVGKTVPFKMPNGDTIALETKEIVTKLSVELAEKPRAVRAAFYDENKANLEMLAGIAKPAFVSVKRMLEAPDPKT